METNKSEPNNKTISLRSLKIWRNILTSGFILSAVVTVICIVYVAVFAVSQSDIFSANWWAGITMGCLVYCVLMLYLFLSMVILDTYNIDLSFLNRCERLNRWCEFVIPPMFLLGLILLCVVLLMHMLLLEISQLPPIPCFFAAILFFVSVILLSLLNETSLLIYEKNNPNYRRGRGFA
ncbi:MAG: hypothetical protein LBU34_12680 [Planctomycetaceae bacterium]|jgi:heme/copper-type cytochrome/quinol oxidase subunit 4|nr:hypothetical protein [Planctomycetaceae bacterium]